MHFRSRSRVGYGRLAQLVEHLVYTERVGGSSPSPPTTRSRLAGCATVIVALVFAGFVAPARAADPMSFRLVTISSSTACRAHCKRPISAEVIAATGEINNSTSDDFLGFLTGHAQDGQLRPVVLLHSPGGTVVGAMQLGTMFRKLGAAVIVARAAEDPDSDHAHVIPGACMSACVYAFFGGAKRVVPTVSRLGIHRMAIYGSEHDPAGGSMATRSFGTDDIVTALASYTKMMGIDPAVISYAETIDPSSIHIVTPREIAHWRMGSPRL